MNMKIHVFPNNNFYLNVGIDYLSDSSFFPKEHIEVLNVMHLSPWSIIDVISCSTRESFFKGKVLIIAHQRLLPLAMYYEEGNNNIIAICEKSNSITTINRLNKGELIERPQFYDGISPLTHKEFISLNLFLSGMSAKQQSHLMGISNKTVFRTRNDVAKKLKVRKLTDLLTHKICTYL